MQNFDVMQKVQSELGSGQHWQSMEKENAQYIDSIAGKLNTLKETWVGIFNTIFSSDATKSIIDGLVSISEAIASVITMLDETKMLTPVLMMLGTMLASKAFTGLSSIFGGGERSARGFANALPGLTRAFANMNPPATRVGATVVGLGTNLAIAGTSVGGFLATAASFIPWAIGGAVAIGGLIAAVDYFTESLDEEKQRLNETISARKQEISSLEEQKGKLQSIQEEYDKLAEKPKKTAKEVERLNELTKQIAEIRPDLVVAYDENDNPILSLTGDVKDLIEEMDRATESKKRLLSVEQEDLAKNSIKQLHGSGLGGGKLESEGYKPNTEMNKLESLTSQHVTKMRDLEAKRDKILNKMYSSTGKERQELLKDLEKANYNIEKQQSDFAQNYQQQLDVIKEYSDKIGEGIFASLESSSTFKNMDTEIQSAFSNLKNSLDFTDIKTEDQLLEVEMSLNSLMKAFANGDVDINNVTKALEDANKAFAKTGDAEKYSNAIDKIISDLEKATGKDFSVLKDVFEGMDTSVLKGKDALDEFLRSYNKTKADLDKDDGFAKALANQKRQIEQTIEELNSVTGDAEIDLELAYNIVNNNELPTELRDMVRVLLNKGHNSTEVVQFAQELLVDISDGNINVGEANEKIKEKFGEGAFEITPDILLSESTKVAGVETVIKQLEERFGEIPPVVKTVIEAEGITAYNSAKEVKETYEEIPDEVKTVMSNNGADTLSDIININNLLGVLPKDVVMNVLTNFPNVVKDAGSVEEIISSLPPSVLMEINSNYPEVVEGSQAIQDAINNIPATKESTVSVKEEVQKSPGGIFDRLFGKKDANLNATATVTAQVNNAKALNDVDDKIKKLTSNGKAVNLKADASDVDKKTKDSQSKVDNIKQKSPTKVNVDNISANNRLKTTKGHLDEIKSKSVTVTVNTNYKTTGSPTPESKGVVSFNQTYQVVPEVQQAQIQSNEMSLLSDTETAVEPMPRGDIRLSRATVGTPISNGYKDTIDSVKYNIELLKELDNRIKMVTNSISSMNEKYKNAIGVEKIQYLQKQNDLYKEQFELVDDLYYKLIEQRDTLWKELENNYGFTFTQDWNISNFEEQMLSMERQYESLKAKADSANESMSAYQGDDENTKNNLKAQYDAAKKEADDYNTYLQASKNLTNEYFNIHLNELPKVNDEWYKLNNQIKENTDALEELIRKSKTIEQENAIKELEYQYDKLADQLSIIDIKMNNAYGSDKLNLIKQQISLLDEQLKIQSNIVDGYKNIANVYKNDLSKYGFEFDKFGDVTNIDEILNSYRNHEDLEKVTKLLDEYIKLQRDEIPNAVKEWDSLDAAIKNAYKEQLNIAKDVEEEITKIYKDQIDKRKKLIDEELKKRLDALKKEKDAYNDYRDSVDYQNDYDDQLNKINDLQKEYDKLSGDNSLGAKKKLEELLKQIEEEQKKLEDLVQDKIDKDMNDLIDKESDRLEQEAEDAKDKLDKDFSDEKIQELVKAALNSGVFESIDGTMRSLQDVMLEFCDEYGDGLSVIGDLIKNEMITNLEIAKDTMKDLANIMSGLDLNKYSQQFGRMSMPSTSMMSGYNAVNSNSQTIQFNSPLINIEGNVDKGVMSNLESLEGRLVDKVCKEMMSKIGGR